MVPTKKKEDKPSEAGEYIAKRDAAEAAKNPGVPLIQANVNPYMYRPGGREQQLISYGAPRPMSGDPVVDGKLGRIPASVR